MAPLIGCLRHIVTPYLYERGHRLLRGNCIQQGAALPAMLAPNLNHSPLDNSTRNVNVLQR